jgi:hypothetical protein
MRKLSSAALCVGMAALLFAASLGCKTAKADVLYTNIGAYAYNGVGLNSPQAWISDPFTLTSDAVITGVTYVEIGPIWAMPTHVDWEITDLLPEIFSTKTADVTTLSAYPPLLDFYETPTTLVMFSLDHPRFFTAGTYYLTLSNAVPTGASYWEESNGGGSTAYFSTAFSSTGDVTHFEISPEAFQILGLAVPEPATWAMLILGFFGLGALLRRRKSQAAALASLGLG